METFDIGTVPATPGELPKEMHAYVIRPEREGEPKTAFQREKIAPPPIGANEVLVLVMAAGINYNNVWAALGQPVSIIRSRKDTMHIGGSDASGIVWKVGSEVKNWKVGDAVVVHCNQSCGQCPACNGQDPMACEQQKIWGYETNWGSFAQFTKVQAQQLMPKPKDLTWVESASYALTYCTAYRMLLTRAKIQPGDWVLVWGAAGGLGIFAVQLCKLMGANAIGVVSSDAKGEIVKKLGAAGYLNRKNFRFPKGIAATPEAKKEEMALMRDFGKALRTITGGKDVDVVFEHVGAETFSISVFVAKKFGKIVICGATSGFELNFDVRYLWMRQKEILGSHFANAYECNRANQLLLEKKIQPLVDDVFDFDKIPHVHQLMYENKHQGKMVCLVGARDAKEGVGIGV